MNLTYRMADKSDAMLLIEIYNAAFYDDYIRYGECPVYGRTKERMEYSIVYFPKLIIIYDDMPVGVISFENKGQGHYFLGCLCVLPAYQGKGVGTQSFKHMLSRCPYWRTISLITPSDSEKNINFYTEKWTVMLKL